MRRQRYVFEWSSLSCRQTATFNQERRQTDDRPTDQKKQRKGRKKKELAWGKASLRHSVLLSISHFISLFGFCPFVHQSKPAEDDEIKNLFFSLSSVSPPLLCISPPGDERRDEMKKWFKWSVLSSPAPSSASALLSYRGTTGSFKHKHYREE